MPDTLFLQHGAHKKHVMAALTRMMLTAHGIHAQVTALGNPKLLERVSGALTALQNLFAQFDKDMNNMITKEEFSQVSGCGPPSAQDI